MKSRIFLPAILAIGLVGAGASSASAFELLNVMFGGPAQKGCCGQVQKGCGHVQKTGACQKNGAHQKGHACQKNGHALQKSSACQKGGHVQKGCGCRRGLGLFSGLRMPALGCGCGPVQKGCGHVQKGSACQKNGAHQKGGHVQKGGCAGGCGGWALFNGLRFNTLSCGGLGKGGHVQKGGALQKNGACQK